MAQELRHHVDLRDALDEEHVESAVYLLGHSMRHNPLHAAAYGPDESTRVKRHAALMRVMFSTFPEMRWATAISEGTLARGRGVGTTRAMPASRAQRLQALPALSRLGFGAGLRTAR